MHLTKINRARFIRQSIFGTAGILTPSLLFSQDAKLPDQLDKDRVREFVGVSHSKFDRVQEMFENEPLLLHVSHDWGGGDFESGIEAAGHVGNKEIANYLLSKGARYNIYLACMLGHLEVVKQVLTFNPGLLNSKGPHGFTMLHHAQRGGEEAKPTEEYLKSLGATVTKIDFYAKT
jgi:hypothetical protein